MNYYERHLGDYAKDTAHLSMLEHGAYGLLLDRYYSTEQGIPEDQAHRVARARSKEERAAVDSVLAEFFTLVDGVWVNGRAEEEISKAQTKINAAKNNGKLGGRPKKNPEQTQEKPSGFPLGSGNGTQTKAHQTPDTKHQLIHSVANATGDESPEPPAGRSRSLSVSDLVKAGIPEPVARDWMAVRKAKKQPLTETAFDAVKRESVKAGMELSAAILVCAERGWVGFKAEWLTQARQNAPNGQTQAGQGGGSQAPIVGPQIAQTQKYLAAQTITETDRAAAIAAAQQLRATRAQMAQ